MKLPLSLAQRLQIRKDEANLRTLQIGCGIDFSSNDYLGFSNNKRFNTIYKTVETEFAEQHLHGSTGSRLISGNSKAAEDLEQEIAKFHGFESALLYNSGYDANLGLFACIAQKDDTLIYDKLVHASIRDGIQLAKAQTYGFLHNDLNDLRTKLKQAKGTCFVVVESVYSMDGDEAPLLDLVTLCEEFGAYLLVDEAHSTGVYGKLGSGLVAQYNLQEKVFACLFTYGKAMACHGAAWCGSAALKEYLINFSRAFIFTTALPLSAVLAIKSAYLVLALEYVEASTQLKQNIAFFKNAIKNKSAFLQSNSAIQGVLLGSNTQALQLANTLQEHNFALKAIRYPTVAKGKERIRIILHSFNTEIEIQQFANCINQFFNEY